jgi:anti-sigma regulatory factor (Ser/Thr protein kinase)
VEEIASNILQHGFYKGGHNTIDIRIVCKDELTIRIHDDCREFDPREHMKLFDQSSPEKAIGLRMVAGLASSIDYYNNAGINTLMIKL